MAAEEDEITPVETSDEAPAEFGVAPDDLRRLAKIVEENNLSELRYEEGDLRITLRTGAFARAATVVQAATAPAAEGVTGEVAADEDLHADALSGEDTAGPALEDLQRIDAPVMGVFYRSPAPGEPPFVEVGDTVEVGQIVGMIEAMKVFSEIPSEVAGIVRDFPARNGALVQPGEPLVLLEAEGANA